MKLTEEFNIYKLSLPSVQSDKVSASSMPPDIPVEAKCVNQEQDAVRCGDVTPTINKGAGPGQVGGCGGKEEGEGEQRGRRGREEGATQGHPERAWVGLCVQRWAPLHKRKQSGWGLGGWEREHSTCPLSDHRVGLWLIL